MYIYQTGDRFDGIASKYNSSIGNWSENMKCGEGTIFYSDGSVFKGSLLYVLIKKGIFEKSARHGPAVLTLRDGTVYDQVWENDAKVKEEKIKEAVVLKNPSKIARSKHLHRHRLKSSTSEGNLLSVDSTFEASHFLNQSLLKKNSKSIRVV